MNSILPLDLIVLIIAQTRPNIHILTTCKLLSSSIEQNLVKRAWINYTVFHHQQQQQPILHNNVSYASLLPHFLVYHLKNRSTKSETHQDHPLFSSSSYMDYLFSSKIGPFRNPQQGKIGFEFGTADTEMQAETPYWQPIPDILLLTTYAVRTNHVQLLDHCLHYLIRLFPESLHIELPISFFVQFMLDHHTESVHCWTEFVEANKGLRISYGIFLGLISALEWSLSSVQQVLQFFNLNPNQLVQQLSSHQQHIMQCMLFRIQDSTVNSNQVIQFLDWLKSHRFVIDVTLFPVLCTQTTDFSLFTHLFLSHDRHNFSLIQERDRYRIYSVMIKFIVNGHYALLDIVNGVNELNPFILGMSLNGAARLLNSELIVKIIGLTAPSNLFETFRCAFHRRGISFTSLNSISTMFHYMYESGISPTEFIVKYAQYWEALNLDRVLFRVKLPVPWDYHVLIRTLLMWVCIGNYNETMMHARIELISKLIDIADECTLQSLTPELLSVAIVVRMIHITDQQIFGNYVLNYSPTRSVVLKSLTKLRTVRKSQVPTSSLLTCLKSSASYFSENLVEILSVFGNSGEGGCIDVRLVSAAFDALIETDLDFAISIVDWKSRVPYWLWNRFKNYRTEHFLSVTSAISLIETIISRNSHHDHIGLIMSRLPLRILDSVEFQKAMSKLCLDFPKLGDMLHPSEVT